MLLCSCLGVLGGWLLIQKCVIILITRYDWSFQIISSVSVSEICITISLFQVKTVHLMAEKKCNSTLRIMHVHSRCRTSYEPKFKGKVQPQMKICFTHPQAIPRHRWVCFFIRTDLEKCSITSLANQSYEVNGCRQNERPNCW